MPYEPPVMSVWSYCNPTSYPHPSSLELLLLSFFFCRYSVPFFASLKTNLYSWYVYQKPCRYSTNNLCLAGKLGMCDVCEIIIIIKIP